MFDNPLFSASSFTSINAREELLKLCNAPMPGEERPLSADESSPKKEQDIEGELPPKDRDILRLLELMTKSTHGVSTLAILSTIELVNPTIKAGCVTSDLHMTSLALARNSVLGDEHERLRNSETVWEKLRDGMPIFGKRSRSHEFLLNYLELNGVVADLIKFGLVAEIYVRESDRRTSRHTSASKPEYSRLVVTELGRRIWELSYANGIR